MTNKLKKLTKIHKKYSGKKHTKDIKIFLKIKKQKTKKDLRKISKFN